MKKKSNEKRHKEEPKIKKIIKKIRTLWDKFPGKINKKQKIFLAIIVPVLLFFIAYTIAYNNTGTVEYYEEGIRVQRPGWNRLHSYTVTYYRPFNWRQTWHIWVFYTVCIFLFEYKLFEDK